jgi:hypothetical protein
MLMLTKAAFGRPTSQLSVAGSDTRRALQFRRLQRAYVRVYMMLEVIADPGNGVPMHILKNEDECCAWPMAANWLTPRRALRSRSNGVCRVHGKYDRHARSLPDRFLAGTH